MLLLAGLAWSAGLIHIQAAFDHLDEYSPYAFCFIATALLQLIWGGASYRRPSRRLLWAGIAGSLGVGAAWVLSRTSGLPLGPDARAPETVGLLDTIATLDELALSALALSLLLPSLARGRRWAIPHRARVVLRAMALLMVLASSLVLGGGFHAH